jgi:iron complex outermembrane receptor protein
MPLTLEQLNAADAAEAARLLDGLPGVSLYQGGGLSSLPTLRGLNDDRINTLVDGIPLVAACPNHMNPVLSYVQPATVSSIQVMPGVTPVSKGGDSIAGTIDVTTTPPAFADGDRVETHGSLGTFYKSVNRSMSVTANLTAATDWLSLAYTGSGVRADDYSDGNGSRVAATSYRAQNHEVAVALRGTTDLVEARMGMQDLPYEGFPNQFMDMLGNQSRYANLHYLTERNWGQLDVRSYWRDTRHFMDFLHDRYTTSDMPMNTKEQEAGYGIKAEIPLAGDGGTLRVGNEFHYDLMRDWWPQGTGTMNPLVFVSLNNASRNRVGTYAEWEGAVAPRWTALVGIRNDTVFMDTGDVQGYRTSGTGSAQYVADSTAFNALDHRRTDINFDLTALARYEASEINSDEIGFAHKTRSPNFYERYAWSTGAMASDMIGWFGDGNGYVGNLDLDSEVASTASATADFHSADRSREAKITPYYTYVDDYIGVKKIAPLMGGFSQFQFVNHNAELYGLNLSGGLGLWKSDEAGEGSLKATLAYVRGRDLTTGGDLYHIMPLNASVTLEEVYDAWTGRVQLQGAARKSSVDDLRGEPVTPAYLLVNLGGSYSWKNIRVDLGVDNLFDKAYDAPLGGMSLGDYVATGVLRPAPGLGRSLNLGLTLSL